MSKIILLADVHIGSRNDSMVFAEYHIDFFINTLFPYMKKNKINTIFQFGDLFDRRKFINFKILHKWKSEVFDYMSNNGIVMHTLLGNHDCSFKNTNKVNSTSLLLANYDNIILHDVVNEVEFDSTKVLVIPWINPENEKETMQQVKKTTASFAFMHAEFAGFEMEKGYKKEDGMAAKEFKKFDTVYSGHYHTKSNDGHIFYLGIPYQITWNDYGDKKGFHEWDTSTLNLKFIENTNTMFERFVYDDSSAPDEYYKGFDLSSAANKCVKIIVVSKKNLYGYDNFMSMLYSQGPADVKIIDGAQEQDAPDEKLNLESTEEILEKAVDSLDNVLDKKILKKMLRELYTEAQQIEVV